MRRILALAFGALLCSAAEPQTVVYTYEYDALGRLLRTERDTGTSTRTAYAYDAADNRVRVKRGTSAPVAVADTYPNVLIIWINDTNWLVDPMYNDTDADFPHDNLMIQSFSGTGSINQSITPNGKFIQINEQFPPCNPLPAGCGVTWSYTIKDAENQTSTSSLDLWLVP